MKPSQTHTHSTEGFALAWSPKAEGALASGDCRGKVHTWAMRGDASWAVSRPLEGHKGSVEDVSWSPCEDTVLATACVDKVCAQLLGVTLPVAMLPQTRRATSRAGPLSLLRPPSDSGLNARCASVEGSLFLA